MKRIITLFCLFLVQIVFSQSVDLDPYHFNLSYVRLPFSPVLEKQNRTFSVKIKADGIPTFNKEEGYISDDIIIDGFKNVPENGYFSILVSLYEPSITSSEIKRIVRKEKDVYGVEQTIITYKAIVNCKERGSYKLDCAGDPSFNRLFSLDREYTLERDCNNPDEGKAFVVAVLKTIGNDFLESVASNMTEKLSGSYGFVIQQTTDFLWILDSKKHSEFDNSKKALTDIRAAFNKMRYNQEITPVKVELDKTIQYLKAIDTRFTAEDRKDKKLRYSAYYNLATIYYYLDMPDESDIWCNKLIANKYDSSDGEGMKARNETLRKRFAINKITSTHLDVEPRTNGIADNSNDDKAVGANHSFKEDKEYGLVKLVLKTNDTISAYTKLSKLLHLDQIIKVSIPDQNGLHVAFKTFNASDVSSVIVGEYDFYSTVSFKAATQVSGGGQPVARFVRDVLNGKNISLYECFNGEIIIKKQGDQHGASTSSVGWQMNTRTKFIELARSCPKLAARANKNEFGNDLNSLRVFVEALDMCK